MLSSSIYSQEKKVLTLDVEPLEHIYFSPSLTDEPIRIPIAKLEKRCSYQHSESVIFKGEDTSTNTFSATEIFISQEHEAQLMAFLSDPRPERFVIRYIDESVGYGLFAKEDIPPMTIIGLYAGETTTTDQHAPYLLGSVDSEKMGGITRFVQHMPFSIDRINKEFQDYGDTKTPADLMELAKTLGVHERESSKKSTLNSLQDPHKRSQYISACLNMIQKSNKLYTSEIETKKFLENIKSLATANTLPIDYIYRGIKINFLKTYVEIKAGQQIGMSYGVAYWRWQQDQARYFDINSGKIIPKEHYLPSLPFIFHELKLPERSDESLQQKKERALRYIAANDISNGYEFMQTLIEYGVNINAADNGKTKNTALHWAVLKSNVRIAELLISCGANLDIENANRETVRPLIDIQDSAQTYTLTP